MTITENIRKELQALVDSQYQEFHSSLLPGANNILGVRIPQLRTMAKEIIKKEESSAVKFTNMVMNAYAEGGNVKLTDDQKRRIQSYFVVMDSALRKAEEDRQNKNANNKNHEYDNPLPYNWKNIEL